MTDLHPFVEWVIAAHSKANNPAGDFATEIALSLPATGTHAELRDQLYWTVPQWALTTFDILWDDYQRTLLAESRAADRHAFAVWLLAQHGEADTPLGIFARHYADTFPATGDRAELRAGLAAALEAVDDGTTSWNLACFDEAWRQFRPMCEAPACTAPVELQMSLCGKHAPLGELL